MTLEILICTIDEGINRIPSLLLSPQVGLTYLVAWQHGEPFAERHELPAEILERDDVRVVETTGKGLSRNRNVALRNASGDILLIADDDCRYKPENLAAIVKTYERKSEADIILFRINDYEGKPFHAYSSKPYEYPHRPKGTFTSSCEITCRRARPLPPFDERFGIGSPDLACGEEEVWLDDAKRRCGLRIFYEPQVIGATNRVSTGTRFYSDPAVQRSIGALHRKLHGLFGALLRAVKYSFDPSLSKQASGASPSLRFRLLRNMIKGAMAFPPIQCAPIVFENQGFDRACSLVIPFRNRAALLPRTLQSLEACGGTAPVQIFLVDNGSTDASAQAAKAFAEKHKDGRLRVTLLSCPEGFAPAARNAGLRAVQTPWVYFFDSDDELSPNFFSEVEDVLSRRPDLNLLAFATRMVFPDSREKTRKVLYDSSPATQILISQLATHGMIFRTDFLRSLGGWNEALPKWNDLELGLRALLSEDLRMEWVRGKAFHRIHQHADSITGTGFGATFAQLLPALEAMEKLVLGKDEACVKALAARESILAGQLRHEGRQKESREILARVKKLQAQALRRPNDKFSQSGKAWNLALSFLFHYARFGFRGAWWWALRWL